MLSQIMAVLKYFCLSVWDVTDLQAAIKYFFETLRNLMVTAAIGLTAKISGSDSLQFIYTAAVLLLGIQVSTVVLRRIEMFSKPQLTPVWMIIIFYLLVALPLSINTNTYIQKIANLVVEVQSDIRKNDKNPRLKEACRFTIDLNNFSCPSEIGVSRL